MANHIFITTRNVLGGVGAPHPSNCVGLLGGQDLSSPSNNGPSAGRCGSNRDRGPVPFHAKPDVSIADLDLHWGIAGVSVAVGVDLTAGRVSRPASRGHYSGREVPAGQIWRKLPELQSPGAPLALVCGRTRATVTNHAGIMRQARLTLEPPVRASSRSRQGTPFLDRLCVAAAPALLACPSR
jgi:hypothetical protein